jgi:hypothetical protein
MWSIVYADVFVAPSNGEDRRYPIPPFSFQITGASRLLFEVNSASAEANWWQAGWCDLFQLDASLPTFLAQEKWQRLPLGNSLYSLPAQGMYQVRVVPQHYLDDIRVRVWAEAATASQPSSYPDVIDGGTYV